MPQPPLHWLVGFDGGSRTKQQILKVESEGKSEMEVDTEAKRTLYGPGSTWDRGSI